MQITSIKLSSFNMLNRTSRLLHKLYEYSVQNAAALHDTARIEEVKEEMKETLSAQEWLKFVGKERLQAFQDSFARSYGIGLCFLNLDGSPLTVWSNSSMFCYTMHKQNKKRCLFEKDKTIVDVIKKDTSLIFTCYMGMKFFICPVYYNNRMIALAYGGGVADAATNLSDSLQKKYDISVVPDKTLALAKALLEKIIQLFNFDLTSLEALEPPDRDTEPEVFDLRLSKRESEVAHLVCAGLSNRQIAQKLFISEKTVKTHVSNILMKMNMKDRLQLIVEHHQN